MQLMTNKQKWVLDWITQCEHMWTTDVDAIDSFAEDFQSVIHIQYPEDERAKMRAEIAKELRKIGGELVEDGYLTMSFGTSAGGDLIHCFELNKGETLIYRQPHLINSTESGDITEEFERADRMPRMLVNFNSASLYHDLSRIMDVFESVQFGGMTRDEAYNKIEDITAKGAASRLTFALKYNKDKQQ